MYLVDTSVWIDYLREKTNSATVYFTTLIENKIPFGITGVIYQEILQGAKSLNDFKQLADYLGTQYFFSPSNEMLTYKLAARLYFDCRSKGLTIRSTIDCLIAQIAIEHKLILLHNDKDYAAIKKIAPALKLHS